jgi:hypothetical protein
MQGLALQVDTLLRGGADLSEVPSRRTLRVWALILVLAGLGYGCVMGTFGGIGGDRILQVLYSAMKVPLLLGVTFAVSLPSFFVLNTLIGLRDDFHRVLGALLATQAALTVVLLSLAPLTALWYLSSADYDLALLFNGGMFAMASVTAQWVLRRRYEPLIRVRPKHRVLLRVWLVIYVFVGIQMAWTLRPFVGNPNLPVQFFRKEAWGNAYEFVAQTIWRALTN